MNNEIRLKSQYFVKYSICGFNRMLKRSQNRKQLECNQALLITSATKQPIRPPDQHGIGHRSPHPTSNALSAPFCVFKISKSFFLHFLHIRNGPFCASLEPIGNGCAFPSKVCCLIRSVLRSGRSEY